MGSVSRREAAGARAGAAAAVASRLRLAQGGGTVLDEVRMSAARGQLADEQLKDRREPPPLKPCRRGAALHAGVAGLICRGESRWHLIRQNSVPPFMWFSSLAYCVLVLGVF